MTSPAAEAAAGRVMINFDNVIVVVVIVVVALAVRYTVTSVQLCCVQKQLSLQLVLGWWLRRRQSAAAVSLAVCMYLCLCASECVQLLKPRLLLLLLRRQRGTVPTRITLCRYVHSRLVESTRSRVVQNELNELN